MPVTGDIPEGAYIASVEGIEDDSSLNLRAEPNTASEVIRRLYKHLQQLIVLEVCEDPAWVKVKTDAVEGYVMVSFLRRFRGENCEGVGFSYRKSPSLALPPEKIVVGRFWGEAASLREAPLPPDPPLPRAAGVRRSCFCIGGSA